MPSGRLRDKLTKENLWLYILSLLKERDMYGYELRAAIAERFGFKPGTVTAYRVLYALKRAGFVETVEKNMSGRERKYYKITDTGRGELKKGVAVLREILGKI